MNSLNTKILLAILSCLIILIGVAGYFYYQDVAEKKAIAQHKAEREKFRKNFNWEKLTKEQENNVKPKKEKFSLNDLIKE